MSNMYHEIAERHEISDLGQGSRPRPHILAVPCPLHGHIMPFLALCDALVDEGNIAISFVTTPRFRPMVERHVAARTERSTNEGVGEESFRVAVLGTDGLPDNYVVSVEDLPTYLRQVEKLEGQLESMVGEMMMSMDKVGSSCGVTCILSDSHLGWVQDVANKFKLPRVCFLTSSTIEFNVIFHQPFLLSQGLLPFTRGVDHVISCIPGLPPTSCYDFPSFVQVEDISDYEFQYFMRQIARVADAERLLVSSFEDLEPHVIKALTKQLNIQAIGPILLLGKEEEKVGGIHHGSEDTSEQWLDKQKVNSVVYIAFGSLANLTLEEVHAIAYGLLQSKQPFIWALREDTVPNVVDPLPPGFRQSIVAQGLIMTWTQQRRLLKHPAIGAFLTHCGWGSTLESVCMGVPLICWPLYGDQLLNCNLLVDQWQAGIRLAPKLPNRRKSLLSTHVESAIVTIINSPIYRQNMSKLQNLAKKACGPNGNSKTNLQGLIHYLHMLLKDAPQ